MLRFQAYEGSPGGRVYLLHAQRPNHVISFKGFKSPGADFHPATPLNTVAMKVLPQVATSG